MDKQIKEIINKYQYDKKTRKYSNKHFFHENKYHSQVNSNDDVTRAYNGVNNRISYFKGAKYDLVNEDIESMEKALGEYEIAIHKVIQCIDNPHCNFSYSSEELIGLINNWDMFENRITEVRIKKLYQD